MGGVGGGGGVVGCVCFCVCLVWGVGGGAGAGWVGGGGGGGAIEVGERYSQATDSTMMPTTIDEASYIPIARIRGSRQLATAGGGRSLFNIVENNLAEPLMGVAFLFLFFRTFARHGTRRWRWGE